MLLPMLLLIGVNMILGVNNIIRHKKHKEYLLIKRLPNTTHANADVLCQEIELNYYTGGVWKLIGNPILKSYKQLSDEYFTVMKAGKYITYAEDY